MSKRVTLLFFTDQTVLTNCFWPLSLNQDAVLGLFPIPLYKA